MLEASSPRRLRVWDLPTRLFHWALAICFVGLMATGTLGGSAMVFHFRFGYAVLTLLLFRLVWGVMGGRWSRFSNFVVSPAALLRCKLMLAPAAGADGLVRKKLFHAG